MQQCTKIILFLILNEAQHVSGDTTPFIRSLKLHKQSLVLHNTVEGCRTCKIIFKIRNNKILIHCCILLVCHCKNYTVSVTCAHLSVWFISYASFAAVQDLQPECEFRLNVATLTLRRLMSYIYIYIYIYIYMEHPFLMFLDHTQRRSTVGRTPLDE